MTRMKIIRRLRHRHKMEASLRDENRKVEEAIKEMQGTPEQDKCDHGSYGNGYIYHTDVCSHCWKILNHEDKQKACLY